MLVRGNRRRYAELCIVNLTLHSMAAAVRGVILATGRPDIILDERIPGFIRQKWDLVLFCVGLLVVAFAGGVTVERYGVFPHPLIEGAVAAAQDWRYNWRHYLQIRSKFLEPTVQTKGGVTRHAEAAAWPGDTFLVLYRDGLFRAVLIDMEGRVLHTWNVTFSEAF